MKVILEQDVAKIGKRGSIVEVPNGYALNQLIPKGMAKPATDSNKKAAEQKAATAAAHNEADAAQFAAAAAALKEATLTVMVDANDEGGLFKAVSPEVIAEAAAAAGVTIAASQVVVGEPIKHVGAHEVALVRGNEHAHFTVTVVKAS